jgi:hypothetical protein
VPIDYIEQKVPMLDSQFSPWFLQEIMTPVLWEAKAVETDLSHEGYCGGAVAYYAYIHYSH